MKKLPHIPMQWFTSDLHFSQKNIIRKLTKWEHADKDLLRGFDSIEDMDSHIIEQINLNVKEKDELYILGDIYFGKDLDYLISLFKQINCLNIYIILGNHDWLVKKYQEELMINVPKILSIKESDFIRISYPLPGQRIYNDKWAGKMDIRLNHYAERIWRNSHKGSYMLYGHSHASLDYLDTQKGISRKINEFYLKHKTMDVDLDNVYRLLGEYRPISREEVAKFLGNKKTLHIDHHETHTND